MQSKQVETGEQDKRSHIPLCRERRGGVGRDKRGKNTSKHQAGSRGPATFCQGQLRCFITTLLSQTRRLAWPWPGSHGSCAGRLGGPGQPQQQCPRFHDLGRAQGHSWRQLQHHLLGELRTPGPPPDLDSPDR